MYTERSVDSLRPRRILGNFSTREYILNRNNIWNRSQTIDNQNNSITSKICGIGVSIVNDAGKIKIINVLEQTPAQFSDIRVGDIVMSVNGEKTSGMSLGQVANLVKGPENTSVNIDILRDGEILTKQIIRKEISIAI